jgi:hypothetical protein
MKRDHAPGSYDEAFDAFASDAKDVRSVQVYPMRHPRTGVCASKGYSSLRRERRLANALTPGWITKPDAALSPGGRGGCLGRSG